ncbi:outer membrane beta-barrel protein [Desertibaculum subflavum]|uniref:outer membrane beta-barrel protein n=1 Tax=Desertibaculum subflavum TaxID=2268458 RepID=UPI0013C3F431
MLAAAWPARGQQPSQEAAPPLKPAPEAEAERRAREALSRRGVPVGSFVLDAGGEISGQYDDNIFATPRRRISDLITTVSPYLALQSNWKQHELKFDAGADIGRYLDHSDEDFEDFRAGLEGRYDLSGGSNLFGGARFNREHESRESPDDVAGRQPTTYNRIETFLGTLQRIGAASIRFGGTWERFDFNDVDATPADINNDDRDRNIFELGSRIGYRVTRELEPFVQGAVNWRRYDASTDDSGFDRDSTGFGVAAGVLVEFMPGVDGEVLIGYLQQNYQGPTFNNRSAVDFGGRLNWQLAPNTRTTFYVDRTLEETTLVGSSGYLNTVAGLLIDHAIRRDLVLTGTASYTHSDFAGTNRLDELYSAGAGIKYFFAPNFYIGTDYRFIRRESNVAAANFDENLVFLRLGAQLADGYRAAGSTPPQDSGLYGGLQAGFGQIGSKLAGDRGSGTLVADFAESGFSGGAFAGYGVTTAPWYLGLEFEAEESEANWGHARLPGGRVFGVDKGPSFGGAVRLGRWLPYGSLVYARVGVVRTEFDTKYRTASGNAFDSSDARYGYRVGGGVEAPLTQRVFLRMDYTYTNYGDYDIATPSSTDNFDNSESVFRLGLGYRFQDLPKAAEQSAPPPARFQGFYAGLQGGYSTLDTDNSGDRDAGSTLNADRGGSGPVGGAFAGYGFLLGDVYLGVELDASLSDSGWEIARDPTGRVYSVDQKESFGASGRIGYVVMDRVLIYGRAGATRTRFTTRYADSGNFVSQDDTITGLRIGGGVEVPATENLFVRFDYSIITSLDTYRVNYVTGVDSFKNNVAQFQAAIGYRF